MNNIEEIKTEVAYYMRRLYEKGLTSCSGGNISVKVNENTFIITPSGKDKGMLESADICICDAEGKPLNLEARLSMETFMHLAIYKKRQDVNAIVHAHPPYSTAYAVCGKAPETSLSGEMHALLGKPVLSDYACMGSAELAEHTAKAASNTNVILLKNHGAITLAENLFQAYNRMEVLESAAKVSFISGLIGTTHNLSPEQLKEIETVFERFS